jgi:hypothetical protein
MDHSSQLHEYVAEYSKHYRNPELPRFAIYAHTMSSWHGTPESAEPGCYVYYSQQGEPLYVGKASLDTSIGLQLAVHDHVPHAPWREKAASVLMIITPDEVEAPSLEEYLIGRLHPSGNGLRHRPQRSLADEFEEDSEEDT